ncbi:RNA-directed DNA polymerase from mobile element jockey [Stylophora pistillata]|uniref:RNA-directed DNA polymerase from mobile element jockey n=1 Tax=Stylophora pistillata TaxID=50429 RepID=A0A2B4SEN4_STYPI|nr:RNA-directed DNA polymerase from mobile element jockey [Stylophora pistillata]
MALWYCHSHSNFPCYEELVGSNPQRENLTNNLEPLDCSLLLKFIYRVTPTTSSIDINWDEVKSKVNKAANPRKASGRDLVLAKDLKLLGDPVVHNLLPLFKKSFDDATFPSDWKLSRVNPIFKNGRPTDVNNFRPISLLNIPGKILEDIVSTSLDLHIKSLGLLSDNQWGFRENYSTEGLLLHLTETWKEALDNGLRVGIVFIDFRKAFDSVNHTILQEKLKAMGIAGNFLSWFCSYLSNRRQFVQLSGTKSNRRFIKYGVPFPTDWKLSRVNPIFKKGRSTDVNNFRPISLLNIPGKILEDIVSTSLDLHIKSLGLLSDNQWGFRENYSTEGLLLHLTESWKEALDNGLRVGIVFIDFRKAFDSVNHTILQEKLKAMGIAGNFLSWFCSYLSNRRQFVQLSGTKSNRRFIKYGVPQGSILGPKLFSVYVNDFPDAISDGELFMFADDTTIFTIGKDVDSIIVILQSILKQVLSWCTSNRLTTHEIKSEALLLSKRAFIGPLPQFKSSQNFLKFTDTAQCLGLAIDRQLSWNDHVQIVCKSFNKKLGVLKRIKFLPKSTVETIYFKTIISSVLYGVAVWGSCSWALLEKLERIHARAARLIYNLPRETTINDLRNLKDPECWSGRGSNPRPPAQQSSALSIDLTGRSQVNFESAGEMATFRFIKTAMAHKLKLVLNPD